MPKKRCKILPAGGLGVSPGSKKVPQDWGIRGLIKIIAAVSHHIIAKSMSEEIRESEIASLRSQ